MAVSGACGGEAPTAPTPPEASFAIRGARIFDGAGVADADSVLVQRGKVTAVGRRIAVPAGIEVHDGSGRTVLPGLIDAHVHAAGPAAALNAPAFGVTTMIDMFLRNTSLLPRFRQDRESSARTAAADVWSAGILATVPGGHGAQWGQIPTLEPGAGAAAFVDARLDEGSDFIKIVIEDGSVPGVPLPTLAPDQVTALVAAAHARGVRTAVHVTTARGAAVAAAAGADLLAHAPLQPVDQPLVDAILRRGMAVVSTIVVAAGSACSGEAAALAADPRIGPRLIPEERATLLHVIPRCLPPVVPADTLASVSALHRAGVPILAGSDAPNPGTAFGASLHGELQLLVRAGLTPAAALAAATSLPAERFGLAERGRIAPGSRADLVLVDGDPTTDITAARGIVTVWKNGYPVFTR